MAIVRLFKLSPVAQNPEGEQLISDMKKMLGVPVFASNDILGAQITEGDGEERARYISTRLYQRKVRYIIIYHICRYSRIGTLYFDTEKLKDWSATSQQTMALFERIRTVGKGRNTLQDVISGTQIYFFSHETER